MMEFRLSASMISCLICLRQINIQFGIPCQLVNLSTSKKNVDIYEIALDILK